MAVSTLYANHLKLKLTNYSTYLSFFPQLISEPVLPLFPLLSASLLSEHVERERDERGRERFQVRTLFHKRGDTSPRSTCITLYAFKETEEHKVSCMTQVRTRLLCFLFDFLIHSFTSPFICPSICRPVSQPPLGLCVVTLTLPSDWFEDQHTNQSHHDSDKWPRRLHPRRRGQKREWQQGRRHRSYFVNRQHATSSSLRCLFFNFFIRSLVYFTCYGLLYLVQL